MTATKRNRILGLLVVIGFLAMGAVASMPASASHNNQGTIKVHDDEPVLPPGRPEQANDPHVSCEFWIEGFNMGDDSGWILFLSWPPTGNMSVVMNVTWTADSEEPAFHFIAGPFQLSPGHYRVEVYTDEGHPGDGHFAKAKTFWVHECEPTGDGVPCPPNLRATLLANGSVSLAWGPVAGADAYHVYRAIGTEGFTRLGSVDAPNRTFIDTDPVEGAVNRYKVTANVSGEESAIAACPPLEVTVPEEQEEAPPCPPNVTASALQNGNIRLTWGDVENATAYNIYRAAGDEPFVTAPFATVDGNTTTFTDTDTIVGVTYRYMVTAIVDGEESLNCPIVEATAIPFFPGATGLAVASIAAVGAYFGFRRRE